MRSIIQKLKVTVVMALLLVGLGAMAHVSTVHAATVTENVACVDGGSGLKIEPDDSNHTVKVTCKDGSQIIYLPQADQQDLIGLKVVCDGDKSVASQIKAPNEPNDKITYYCVTAGNPPTKANVTPTLKPVAAIGANCPDGVTPLPASGDASKCPGMENDPAIGSGNCTSASHCDLMSKYVYPLINFLSALVGVAVIISIIIGGIQYGSSAGDPAKVTAAKNRIRNSIIALVTFIFLYALLNFLVPGGVFNR